MNPTGIKNKRQLIRTKEYLQHFQEYRKELGKQKIAENEMKRIEIACVDSVISTLKEQVKNYKKKEPAHEKGNDGKDSK